MSFGTILLHLGGGDRESADLGYTVRPAAEHGAHLIALRTIAPFYPTVGPLVMPLSALSPNFKSVIGPASVPSRPKPARTRNVNAPPPT
ncbi:MAG: hypothetical protein EXQ99_08400 [Alphaproteobacteria bacterium]|nr:hypothetical protein [Alphaproteobacteria bacterium]